MTSTSHLSIGVVGGVSTLLKGADLYGLSAAVLLSLLAFCASSCSRQSGNSADGGSLGDVGVQETVSDVAPGDRTMLDRASWLDVRAEGLDTGSDSRDIVLTEHSDQDSASEVDVDLRDSVDLLDASDGPELSPTDLVDAGELDSGDGGGALADDTDSGDCTDAGALDAAETDVQDVGCEPECQETECGYDGCGGSCGECDAGSSCVSGTCLAVASECDDGNDVPWDGCTLGNLSETRISESWEASVGGPLALDAGSSFLVAWLEAPEGPQHENESQLKARFVSQTAAPLGEELVLATGIVPTSYLADGVRLAGGELVLAWREGAFDEEATPLVKVLLLAPDGIAVAGPFVPPSPLAFGPEQKVFRTAPGLAALQDGTFVVGWSEGVLGETGPTQVAVVKYDHTAAVLNSGTFLSTSGGGQECIFGRPSMAVLAGSGQISVLLTFPAMPGPQYCDSGVAPPMGGEWGIGYPTLAQLDCATLGAESVAWVSVPTDYLPHLHALSNGNLLLSWTTSLGYVMAEQFDAEGNWVWSSSPFQSWTAKAVSGYHRSASNPTGGWSATWMRQDPGGEWFWEDVVVRAFDGNGAAYGPEQVANVLTGGSQETPHLACDASGQCLVVWQSQGGPVFGRVFKY